MKIFFRVIIFNMFQTAICSLSQKTHRLKSDISKHFESTKTMDSGFSLFEVLISLVLITSISLAILKQQWQSNLFLIDAIHHITTLVDQDNQQELNPFFAESKVL